MHNEENDKEKYNLYTERIVESESGKKKKKPFKIFLILCIIVACAVFAFVFLPKIIWNFSHVIDAENSELSIEQDEDVHINLTENDESVSEIDNTDLLKNMPEILDEINKSIVVVSEKETSLFGSDEKENKSGIGVVVGETESRYVILTDSGVIDRDSSTIVAFGTKSEESVPGYYLAESGINGIGLISVKKSAISDEMKQNISVINLGNSKKLTQGLSVIACGDFNGFNNGYDHGIISEITATAMQDNNSDVIKTNIKITEKGFGFLFDADKNLIGIMSDNLTDTSTFSAVGISDIKKLIEKLSSGNDMPYVGIYPKNITDSIASLYNMPKGIFVEKVEIDSPAYKAGIQQGDIIYQIGKTDIASVEDYVNVLYDSSSGQNIKVYVMRQGKDGYTKLNFNVSTIDKNDAGLF